MRARLQPRQRLVRRRVGIADPPGAGDDQERRRQLLDQRPAERRAASRRRLVAQAPAAARASPPGRAGAGRAQAAQRRAARARPPATKADQRRQPTPPPRAPRAPPASERQNRMEPVRHHLDPRRWHRPLSSRADPGGEEGLSSSDRNISIGLQVRDEECRMIRYALRCDQAHRFDSWFGSSADFDRLSAAGLIACAVCGSDRGREGPDGAEHRRGRRPSAPLSAPASPAEQALAELRRRIEAQSRERRPQLRRRGAAHPRGRGAGARDHRRGAAGRGARADRGRHPGRPAALVSDRRGVELTGRGRADRRPSPDRRARGPATLDSGRCSTIGSIVSGAPRRSSAPISLLAAAALGLSAAAPAVGRTRLSWSRRRAAASRLADLDRELGCARASSATTSHLYATGRGSRGRAAARRSGARRRSTGAYPPGAD